MDDGRGDASSNAPVRVCSSTNRSASSLMSRPNCQYSCSDLGDRSIGGLGDVHRRAVESSERIIPITRALFNSSRHLRMSSLDEQCADPADERRRVADHAPRNRVRPEQPRIPSPSDAETGGCVDRQCLFTTALGRRARTSRRQHKIHRPGGWKTPSRRVLTLSRGILRLPWGFASSAPSITQKDYSHD